MMSLWRRLTSPRGYAVLPKVRRTGLIERCAPPGGN